MNELFQIGLVNALAAVVLAIPAWLVSRWGRRPALAHALWLLVLLKLIAPPVWQLPVAWVGPKLADHTVAVLTDRVHARLDVSTSPQGGTGTVSSPPWQGGAVGVAEAPVLSSSLIEPSHVGLTPRRSPETREAIAEADAAALLPVEVDLDVLAALAIPAAAPATAAVPTLQIAIPWVPIFLGLWITGTASYFLLTAFRIGAMVRYLGTLEQGGAEAEELIRRLSASFRLIRRPVLCVAHGSLTPFVWALGFRPRIVVPSDLWRGLDAERRAALVAHEMAHLRRGDHWVRVLELIVRGLYWWHPLVWWAGHELSEAEEQCCDAWAIWALPGSARTYAQVLMDTVDFLADAKTPLPAGATGMGKANNLRRRLIMIMKESAPRKLSATALVCLIGLGGLLVGIHPTWANALADEDDKPDAPKRRIERIEERRGPGPRADEGDMKEKLDRAMQELARHEERLKRDFERQLQDLHRKQEELKKQMSGSMEDLNRKREAMRRQVDERRRAVKERVEGEIGGVAIEVEKAKKEAMRQVERAMKEAGGQIDVIKKGVPPVRALVDGSLDKRITHLEQQMNELMQELRAMRRDLDPGRRPAPGAPGEFRRQPRPGPDGPGGPPRAGNDGPAGERPRVEMRRFAIERREVRPPDDDRAPEPPQPRKPPLPAKPAKPAKPPEPDDESSKLDTKVFDNYTYEKEATKSGKPSDSSKSSEAGKKLTIESKLIALPF